MSSYEIDNYLYNVYSDETYPEGSLAELTWVDELDLGGSFEQAVEQIRAALELDGDYYSSDEVALALRKWLEESVSITIKDAPALVSSGHEEAKFRSVLARQKKVPTKPLEKAANIYTGFRKFSAEAVREMVLFFASKPGGVLKTKLNKLLWYADFFHFRAFSSSISGATYVHLPYGPVPNQYENHLAALIELNALSAETVDFGDLKGTRLKSKISSRTVSLPSTAMPILEAVYRRFERASSTEMSNTSHNEIGYQETRQGQPISYAFASDLKVRLAQTDSE
jgi:hypothetical protein